MVSPIAGLPAAAGAGALTMADIAARYGVKLVITHSQGTPETMRALKPCVLTRLRRLG